MDELINTIQNLVNDRKKILQGRIKERKEDMLIDDKSHFLIYNLLGITDEKGFDIDLYQNIGRFLYRHTGELMEELALETLLYKYPNAKTNAIIPNNISSDPNSFEIDFLIEENQDAIEIKWRDATTDGDHVKKEKNLVLATKKEGYHPIRVMFFYPNRKQAIRIQDNLREYYDNHGGDFFAEQEAWDFITDYTGVNLKEILLNLA